MDPKVLYRFMLPVLGGSVSVSPTPLPAVEGAITMSGSGSMSIDGTVQDATSFLLDTYAGTAAYSFRKLSSTYSGTAAVIIRRSSDNGTAAFGWDGNGDFDTAGAASYIGAGTGYIRRWYDQSGNGWDANQNSTSLQPRYGTAQFGGKPSGYFQSADSVVMATTHNIGQTWIWSCVFRSPASLTSWPLAYHGASNQTWSGGNLGAGYIYSNGQWAYLSAGVGTNTNYVFGLGENGGNALVAKQGTVADTDTPTAGDHTIQYVGSPNAFQPYYIAEMIWFNEGTATLTDVQDAQNSYFGIY